MLTAPSSIFIDVSSAKSDTVDLPNGPCRSLYIGNGGNIVVIPTGGTASITFNNVQSGSILPIQVKRVISTNTTVSNIIALY